MYQKERKQQILYLLQEKNEMTVSELSRLLFTSESSIRRDLQAMARTVQEKLHTDIAVGITGTTGNLDLNNADSVQGRVFFCILIHDEANCFEVNADVTGMTRHEIKQMYAERVFDALDRLVFPDAE